MRDADVGTPRSSELRPRIWQTGLTPVRDQSGKAGLTPVRDHDRLRPPQPRMDLDEIKQILDLMREHDLAEFELERESGKVRLRKQSSSPQFVAAAPALSHIAYAPPAALAPA